MVIKGYNVGPLLKKTVREIGSDRVPTLAASAAYNFFFSLFPLLLFLAPLLSLVGDKRQLVGYILSRLTSVMPPQHIAAIQPVLDDVVFSSSAPGLMSIGAVLAAWSGSNIFGTLMGALNTAYGVQETRSWIKQQLIRLMSFALGGLILAASTIVLLNGEGIADWVGRMLHLGGATILIWKIAQFPIALAGLVLFAYMTFTLLPNVKQKKSQVLVAAIVTTVLWIIATLAFRLYITHFPPNPAYGLVGAVIILLTWMYYTMFVVLVGGEFASELQHGTGAVDPDKGATYVGRIVTGAGPGSASVERKTG
jgi:membrane protein